jgi:hypothetical protein
VAKIISENVSGGLPPPTVEGHRAKSLAEIGEAML